MIETVLVVAGAWLILSLCGWVLLGLLPKRPRDLLLPAAPLFGVVLFVVVLHDTTLLLPVRIGVWVLLLVVVGLAVLAFRRDGQWWRPAPKAVGGLLVAAGCAVLPAIWVLGPAFAVHDAGVIQPNQNNDAFYYVTVSDWLQDHPATDVPRIGSTPDRGGVPPSFASARAQLGMDLRIGQELTHAGLSTLLGADVERTWYGVTALWVLLLPAAGAGAARLFRMTLAAGLAFGTATSLSSLVIFQVASQNSDSLLGIALAPLALGGVVAALRREPDIPAWLAGLTLAALVGTYTEMLPLVAPALVVLVLARSEIGTAVGRAVVLLAVGIIAAPLIWLRAVKSLLFLGGIATDNFPSAFHDAPLTVVISRFLGLTDLGSRTYSPVLLLVVSLLLLVGLVAAVRLSRLRWFALTLVVVGVVLSVYFVTVRQRPYTQQRVVQLYLPLLLLVAALGWDRLWRRCRRDRGQPVETGSSHDVGLQPTRRAQVLVVAAGVALAGSFAAANSVTDRHMDLPAVARQRHVGPAFEQAASWVRKVGGAEGSRVLVLSGDFFDQLWITDALRSEEEVAYPSLFVSYQYQQAYWDGRPRRWLLVDRAVVVRTDPGVVVRHNARFRLLDLSRGRAVVAAPADEMGRGSLLLLRSPSTPRKFLLRGDTRPRNPTDPPPTPADGTALPAGALGPGTRKVAVVMPEGTVGERLVPRTPDFVFVLTHLSFH